MSSEIKSCYIYSDNKSLSSVYLPDKQEVYVGRSIDTKIQDSQCSRKQVRLYANYADQKVFIEQVGLRSSGLNGFKTERGGKLIAQHGDCLEILYGKHFYKIEFNPPPNVNIKSERIQKRLLSQEFEDDDSQKLKKTKFINNDDDQLNIKESIDKKPMEENAEKSTDLLDTESCTTNSINSYSKQNGKWEEFSNKTLYLYTSSGCEGRSKIAAYDMDKTLIKTISGLQFPKDCNDWQLLYPEVSGKIKKYYEDGYKVVIFSNQAGLGTGKVTLKDFKLKIEKIVKKIGVPMQVYLAVGESIYRKPRTGMWDFLVHKKNDGIIINKEKSFFVGDAAGRPADASRKKKDHSLADRLLAININLTFHTPEEHFLGHKKAAYNAPIFDPKEASKNTILHEPANTKLISNKQELIVMVGSPGSGKSHFAKTHLNNYFYVSRDILGSWQKCVANADKALDQGKSVVIDNTNPDKSSRQRYIEIAKKYKVPVRCFVMSLEKEHVKHNNMFRILTDPTHQAISDMILNSYVDTKSQLARRCIRFVKLLLLLCLRLYIRFSIYFSKTLPTSYRKNFIPPSEHEGFSEIVKIKFVPSFKSEKDRQLYEMYLLG